MSRVLVVLWVTSAILCGLLGSSVRGGVMCVAIEGAACEVLEIDSCCSGPAEEPCAPDDGCCIDIPDPVVVDPQLVRTGVSRDTGVEAPGPVHVLYTLPPPVHFDARLRGAARIGPPRQVDSIVRSSRLLL
ncbi:MAG: hypothetical protein KF684_05140 [Phycisphaeraceae bacterium]|nr:hypothetical protein [Phycisphaeraceae bacterium]